MNLTTSDYDYYYHSDSYDHISSLDTFDNYYEQTLFSLEIRVSIFYIGALCTGLPCLIWALYLVYLQRKTRGRISAFIILLLVSDLLQMLLYPYIVSKLFSSFSVQDTTVVVVVCAYLKVCSLHLHQLVALEGALTLKYPQVSAHIFSLPCYVIISLVTLLFPGFCILAFVFQRDFSLVFGSFLVPVYSLVVTGIITFKAPPTPVSSTITEKRPGAMVFLVSTVTLVVLYLPCVFLLFHFHIEGISWHAMIFCLLGLTVISEPVLCVLVCRENLSTQKTHTRIELNSEQTSV